MSKYGLGVAMSYFTTINSFRFGLVLSGFISLVSCGDLEQVAMPANESPTASSVSIIDNNEGDAVPGDSLTGNYVYTDAENDAEGETIFQWLRNGDVINGATAIDYTLAAADSAANISFEVTPIAVAGTTTGLSATSGIISVANRPPVANAGADQTPVFGETVNLNGGSSSDIDGNPLTFIWSLISRPAGSSATLSAEFTASPSFVVDVSGDYVAQLIVNDGLVDSVADTVDINTSNSAPVANAGAGQTPLFGETVSLNGGGSSDVDGDLLTFSWSIISRPAGSFAILSAATTVNPSFEVDVSGSYVVQLIVNDGLVDSVADTVGISTNNSPPVANAGADQTPLFGETVNLNGGNSSDVDGNMLTFIWSIISRPAGSSAILSAATTVNPSFVVDVSGSYVAQLIVNDGLVDSDADTVGINTSNSAPVANAGTDQTPLVGETVNLNGGGSSDVDGNALTFSWSIISKPIGSFATLSAATAVNPSFEIDVSGSYIVQLIVNDGLVDSIANTVDISTSNSAPVANAGADQTPLVGETVNLNGDGSSDVDGNTLTFSWSLISRPAGSIAMLSAATTVNPSFVVDVSGNYVVQLIVNDGSVDSVVDTVSINTSNSAPVANAGADQSPFFGETVNLNGSSSSDVDNNPLTFIWSLISRPAGSTATLSAATTVSPSFVVDVSGNYVVQLIVNDGLVDSVADTVNINTSNSAPVANAGADQTMVANGMISLDGSGSSDVDGDTLIFDWAVITRPPGRFRNFLSSATAESPTFTAKVAGHYVVQLIVNDNVLDSVPNTMTITVTSTDD
jgi:hypothetical protein